MQPTTLTLTTLALLALGPVGTLAAQGITSPLGLDTIEGNSSHTALFGAVQRHFQQIDGTVIAGGARTISSIAFRQDGVVGSNSATTRTMNIEVVMGHGDADNVSPVFADNYLDTPVVVRASQSVTMPDWSAGPTGTPEAFDFVVPLDTPFLYDGVRALVWEISISQTSNLGLVRIDRQVDAFASTQSSQVTAGCTTTGSATPFENRVDAFNYGPTSLVGQRMIIRASGAPNDAPVAVDICLATTPIPFPGLCAPFAPDVIATLAMGLSNPTGFAPDLSLDIPYNPLLDTLPFQTQAIALDVGQPGIPVVVSDVQTILLPAPAAPLACHYVVGVVNATSGTVFPNRGDVVKLD